MTMKLIYEQHQYNIDKRGLQMYLPMPEKGTHEFVQTSQSPIIKIGNTMKESKTYIFPNGISKTMTSE